MHRIERARILTRLDGRKISEPLLRYFATTRSGSPQQQNDRVDSHLDKIDAAERRFEHDPRFDRSARAYFRGHYYADPEQAVQDYFDRHQVMQEFTMGDPDVDSHVVSMLCLRNTDVDVYPEVIRAHKQLLTDIRDTVELLGAESIDEDILRSVAVHARRYPTIIGYAVRAIRSQRRRHSQNGDSQG